MATARMRKFNGYPTDPRVLMVGLLAQPEKGLVGPDDVAELQLWSSLRLLANASSEGRQSTTKTEENTAKSMQFTSDAARSQHHENSHEGLIPTKGAPRHKRAGTENLHKT